MRVSRLIIFIALILIIILTTSFFVSACKSSGTDQSCQYDSDCCSANCEQGPISSYCAGSFCGDNVKNTPNSLGFNESCDGPDGCSLSESCKSDCSGCVAPCSSSSQCRDENGEWGYGSEYFCNIDGDGVLCSEQDGCYVLIDPNSYPVHDCTTSQICSEGECFQCTQEDTSKCTSGFCNANNQCCTPQCANPATVRCGDSITPSNSCGSCTPNDIGMSCSYSNLVNSVCSEVSDNNYECVCSGTASCIFTNTDGSQYCFASVCNDDNAETVCGSASDGWVCKNQGTCSAICELDCSDTQCVKDNKCVDKEPYFYECQGDKSIKKDACGQKMAEESCDYCNLITPTQNPCVICDNECTLDAQNCTYDGNGNTQIQTCLEDNNGCTYWDEPVSSTCTPGMPFSCSYSEGLACSTDNWLNTNNRVVVETQDDSCDSCETCYGCEDPYNLVYELTGANTPNYSCSETTCSNECILGATQCFGGSVQTCEEDGNGCLVWNTTSCDFGEVCSVVNNVATCVPETTCEENNGFCSDSIISNADAIAGVCSSGTCYSCNDGYEYDGTSCVPETTCSNDCTTSGDTRCSGGSVQTCEEDDNGCLVWNTTSCDDNNPCTIDTCSSGDCTHTDIPPVCPRPSSVQCGSKITPTNSCGVCEGSGTSCSSGVCDTETGNCVKDCGSKTLCSNVCVNLQSNNDNCGSCNNECAKDELCLKGVCEDCFVDDWLKNSYTLEGNYLLLKLNPQVICGDTTFSDYTFQYQELVLKEDYGYFNKSDVPLEKTNFNQKSFLIKVFKNKSLLFNNTFSFQLNCSGSCCSENHQYWVPDGTSCDRVDKQPGVCQSGTCNVNCADEDYFTKVCSGDKIITKDACGKDFETTPCGEDSSCQTKDGVPTCVQNGVQCSNNYEYQCSNNNIIGVDTGCGETFIQKSCGENEFCNDNQGNPGCQLDCGQLSKCDQECVDLEFSHDNCGSCNNKCDSQEQCVGGVCQSKESCLVACDKDQDCSDGEVCLNPGDCYLSQCSTINVKEQTQDDLQEIQANLEATKSVGVKYFVENGEIHFVVKNYLGVVLNNVSFDVKINKVLAKSANKLLVKGVKYEVVNLDPSIKVLIPSLASSKEFTINPGKPIDVSHVNFVSVSNILVTPPKPGTLEQKWKDTKKILDLGIDYTRTEEGTDVKISLRPQANLKGVNIPIQIPKCMAQYADELKLKGNYKIIQDDPLIVWQFDEVKEQQSIEFTVPKDISEDCKQQLRAIGLAQSFSKPLNPFLPLLIIPLIALLLVFNRFAGKGHAQVRLSKEEYFEVAKQSAEREGTTFSKENTERNWLDYKRRF